MNVEEFKTKICKRCKRELPSDLIHFNKQKSSVDGLRGECKECRGLKFRVPYNYGVNEETERKCSVCQIVYPKTEEFFSWSDKTHTKYNSICKKCAAKKQRNRPNRKEYYTKYIKSHPEINRNKCLKRYNTIKSNANTLTQSEWLETLIDFGGRCGYCGRSNGITQEHIIPISKGGATSKNNVIPACNICNSSKKNNDFKKWYSQQSFFNAYSYEKIIKFMEEK